MSARPPETPEAGEAVERLLQRQHAAAATAAAPLAAAAVDCPPQQFWPLFVRSGEAESANAAALVHAAGCAHCGPLLRAALERQEEERGMEAILTALPSSTERGRARLARQLARQVPMAPRPWLPPLWPPRWAAGLVAAVVVAAAGVWIVRSRGSAPAALLAQAYDTPRTLDFRIAGAAYAPMAARRGTNSQPPAALLEAEAALAAKLEKTPADPALLALRGRAELLDLRYGDAITDLNAALARQPGNAAVLVDLASAYFERAQQTGRAADFTPALEDLGEVLVKTPDNALALYNRAVIEEQFPMPVEAAADWAAYLKVDDSSPWAAEARAHLAALKKK